MRSGLLYYVGRNEALQEGWKTAQKEGLGNDSMCVCVRETENLQEGPETGRRQRATNLGGVKLTPWKEGYDQPRQHIQKQRHYFANKDPPSQGYGFSSGHVWM